VEKIKRDRSEFEICNVNERVVSRMPFNKKFLYVHLKEQKSGNTYWDILVMKSTGEPEHYTLGKEDDE
jgi:hypothetical protein